MRRRDRGSPTFITKPKVNLALSHCLSLSLIDSKHKLFNKFVVLRISLRAGGIDDLGTLALLQKHGGESLEMRFPMESRHDLSW